jgi:hypothetical protein
VFPPRAPPRSSASRMPRHASGSRLPEPVFPPRAPHRPSAPRMPRHASGSRFPQPVFPPRAPHRPFDSRMPRPAFASTARLRHATPCRAFALPVVLRELPSCAALRSSDRTSRFRRRGFGAPGRVRVRVGSGPCGARPAPVRGPFGRQSGRTNFASVERRLPPIFDRTRPLRGWSPNCSLSPSATRQGGSADRTGHRCDGRTAR